MIRSHTAPGEHHCRERESEEMGERAAHRYSLIL
jgi:hypothetical protein